MMETTVLSMKQMDALNEAISGITVALQKLVEVVEEWIENFRKLLSRIFPPTEANGDCYGAEAKKECSVKAFVLRTLSRPRRFWKKLVRRFTCHEADN